MSMTGSLMGYENNNEVNQAKCKKPLKPLPVVTSVNASGVTTATRSRKSRQSQKRESCTRFHVNSLWSVWYGIIAVTLQAYIATRCVKRFTAYLSLPWPVEAPPPKMEIHACLVLVGTGMFLLLVLLATAVFKVGNLANDGIKLGRHLSACSRDPPSSVLTNNPDTGLANNLWRHGGPTAAFVHLCTAMCFLLPSLLMEARLIHAGFLPKEAIWRTDLDWVMIHHDRLVLLGFMNPPNNMSQITPQPYVTSTPFRNSNEDRENSSSTFHESTWDSFNDEVEENTKQTTFLLPHWTSTSIGDRIINLTTDRSSTLTTTTTTTTTNVEGSSRKFGDNDGEMTTTFGSKFPSKVPVTTMTSSTTRKPTQRIIARSNSMKNRAKKQGSKMGGRNFHGGNMTGQSLPLTFNSLSDLDHPEHLNLEFNPNEGYGNITITLEYLNYAMALGVYSVRYPAVFWSCNKALGTIFSLQLVVNSAQSLLAFTGMSVLYKVQVVGPLKVLPYLRHRAISTATTTISKLFGHSFFLLNPHATLGLFALSSLLVLCSSMVMYLYAHGRFMAFLNQERERRVIILKEGRYGNGWGYITHCAALCVFLAIAFCSAPLLSDFVVVYRGSLDGAVLVCIISTVLHLFLWLILWIFLIIKQKWIFKLRVTVGRATVRSARSVKLVTDVDLLSARDEEDGTTAPLLVVGNGRTYTIADTSPKKAIMSVIQKAAMERKARGQGLNGDSVDGESAADGAEQIYWLRPKFRPSPTQSPNDGVTATTGDKGWLNKKLKPKVTFNDLPSTSGSRNKGKARRGVADGGPDDDGDYATLRELPLMTSLDPADDSTSEENKHVSWQLLECVNDDQVTYYASGNRDLQPSEGDPSPLLTPDPLPDPASEPLPLPPPTPTSEPSTEVASAPLITNAQVNGGQTPRCLRRADSGMPHDELTPRSDSSNSPPLDVGINSTGHNSNTSTNSETSSGVHSNASNASNASSSQRRATSVDDLTGEPREEPQWRSCSLQRGVQPPTANTVFPPPPPPLNHHHHHHNHNHNLNNNNNRTNVNNFSPQYVNHNALYNGGGGEMVVAGCPAVILENTNEATVVIRRRSSRTKLSEPLNHNEEPFGRSTNMRMTSFTENTDLRSIQASSATLPHYPTQPMVTYPHCSTMPLPHASHSMSNGTSANGISGGSGSCGSVSRNVNNLPSVVQHTSIPSHTTLPSHHNGVRLIPGNGGATSSSSSTNPFVKRFPNVSVHTQGWALPGHHTFPQLALGQKLPTTAQIRQSDRDSANFSMASSGDSDTCLPH
ncbi:protein tincar isoform X3 [Leptopilina heterotoma]|uniref:protein tincar isoform X3 n=1 Tax=Leptopilina heterotoma TaxID=63436 RepID=UPI001CA7D232|nr:protein tincar isoform X3 [Leptopilina heterotoma]